MLVLLCGGVLHSVSWQLFKQGLGYEQAGNWSLYCQQVHISDSTVVMRHIPLSCSVEYCRMLTCFLRSVVGVSLENDCGYSG